MDQGINLLLLTAVITAAVHTFMGTDHYAPLAAFAGAHHWTKKRIVGVTLLCGLGHILSSVFLGGLGIFLDFSFAEWQGVNTLRGEIAAWVWIAAGLLYLVWAAKDWYRHKRGFDAFVCEAPFGAREWVFFVIFVLGPCEPLILFMQHPILKENLSAALMVIGVFGATTIVTMLALVLAVSLGLDSFRLRRNEGYAHFVAAGLMIFCGAGIKFLGL